MKVDVVVNTCNSQEAEAGDHHKFKASLVYIQFQGNQDT